MLLEDFEGFDSLGEEDRFGFSSLAKSLSFRSDLALLRLKEGSFSGPPRFSPSGIASDLCLLRLNDGNFSGPPFLGSAPVEPLASDFDFL